jgi:hypothetical protein
MPIEQVTLTVAGANPQSTSIQVNVDPSTGIGSGSFVYTGVNSGADTVTATATIAGNALTSNPAGVNWQATNGSIQVGEVVTAYMWNDSPTSGAVAQYTKSYPLNVSTAQGGSATGNSLVFDNTPSTSGVPVSWAVLNSAGTIVGATAIFPGITENFNMVVLGQLLVPAPGTYTLTFLHEDNILWGIGGGATWPGKGTITAPLGQTKTAVSGFPLLPLASTTSGGTQATASAQVTFTSAGVYAIEGNWDYWYHSGRTAVVKANGANIAPVLIMSAPPSSTPSGSLQLTPSGGAQNLVLQGQSVTLNISVSGIVYDTVPYIPLLQGTASELEIYNSATAATYTLDSFNGATPTMAQVAAAAFSISGSNGSYQNRLSVIAQGNLPVLSYNGSAPDPNVASTNITISAADLAWFSSKNSNFDVFTPSASGGGVSYEVEVYWLVRASVSSVSPTSVPADGGSHIFVMNLAQPLPPLQSATQATVTGSSGLTVTGVTTNVNSSGWITGYTVTATAAQSASSTTGLFTVTLSGTITYLDGTGFTTGPTTYSSGNVGISLTGTGGVASNPSVYAWNVNTSGHPSGHQQLRDLVLPLRREQLSLRHDRNVLAQQYPAGWVGMACGLFLRDRYYAQRRFNNRRLSLRPDRDAVRRREGHLLFDDQLRRHTVCSAGRQASSASISYGL